MERKGEVHRVGAVCILILALSPLASAQYGGGTGEPNDPYLIYTPEQMNAIGADPNDWDKHFKLMANIDLAAQSSKDCYVLGTDQENPFTGVFDGNGHTISNFTYTSSGSDHVGFFGYVEGEDAEIRGLGLITPSISTDTMGHSGALAGILVKGTVTDCFVRNGVVRGDRYTGGLVGYNRHGVIQNCYVSCAVTGNSYTGGLVGYDDGAISHCYAAGVVVGDSYTGGLVGGEDAGLVTASFWDIEISGQPTSDAGTGLTTAELRTAGTFRAWIECGTTAWTIDEGNDYPRLAWENQIGTPIAATPAGDFLTGSGTLEDPYLIYTSGDLNRVGWALCDWDKHFKLMADIDLSGGEFNIIGLDQHHPFRGVFDGNGHTISNFLHRVSGGNNAGFFGYVDAPNAQIKNVGLINPTVDVGSGQHVGALAGCIVDGVLSNCRAEGGRVTGGNYVGGLVGRILVGASTWNPVEGASVTLTACRSANTVTGLGYAGGLVGENWRGKIANCCASGTVTGNDYTGGLVGNGVGGMITCCYSTCVVDGNDHVGGLVGSNGAGRSIEGGGITRCYIAGAVAGNSPVGGLFGSNYGTVSNCVWDIGVSGQTDSPGGAGLTTEQMKDPQWLALNGWANDSNWILDAGRDYPRLAWEETPGQPIPSPALDWIAGSGTVAAPYEVAHRDQLAVIQKASMFWDKHLTLFEDIDLQGLSWSRPILPEFGGCLDGRGSLIRNLTVVGKDRVGLIGRLYADGQVRQLGIIDANVTGAESRTGILIGQNHGQVSECYTTGQVNGQSHVGGLVGLNSGSIRHSYSMATVTGESIVGGLVGQHSGGLDLSYSAGRVSGDARVGGLVGYGSRSANTCVWDMEACGQVHSAGYGAVGLTTTQIMDPEIMALNDWAFDPNWVLDVGCDYPRLVWEGTDGTPIPEPSMDWIAGNGLRTDPYQIADADQMVIISVAPVLWDRHLALVDHIDVSGLTWHRAVLPRLDGSLDGCGFAIKNLSIIGGDHVGFVGYLPREGRVRNLALTDANINGSGRSVGILVAYSSGQISLCYSTGLAIGKSRVGGLVGDNSNGAILYCCSHASVQGDYNVGGLVGYQYEGQVMQCYSAGPVSGRHSYSSGGLVGTQESDYRSVIQGFWDKVVSGQTHSAGGLGRTTVQMMDPAMYAEAGWDFRGVASDGLHEAWQISAEGGYPILSIFHDYKPPALPGAGTSASPYLIATAAELGAIVYYDNQAYYRLENDIDLSDVIWSVAVLPYFSGHLDGNGFAVQNLTGYGESNMGLVGRLSGGRIYGLAVIEANISASGKHAGILAGWSWGVVSRCFSTGTLDGKDYLGGLVGRNDGGHIILSHSTASVSGSADIGGLTGSNRYGRVIHCYSAGPVTGAFRTGGLVGRNYGIVDRSFWDMETSGQVHSAGGVGLTTAQMTDANAYLNAGWDFPGESKNGLHETWRLPDAGGYPVLSLRDGMTPVVLSGEGTETFPYRISTPTELAAVANVDRSAYCQLANDIDLAGIRWSFPVIPELKGNLDGNGHVVYGLTMAGISDNLSLVGELAESGYVRQLGVADANVAGTGDNAGILAGVNAGLISQCFTGGAVSGENRVGGLVGHNRGGTIINSYSTVSVYTHQTGASSRDDVGGLAGSNSGGIIETTYSTGNVRGPNTRNVPGGLLGSGPSAEVYGSYWDIETSGQVTSSGGMGLTTAEMMTAAPFLAAGWDFVGEVENGVEEVWWIDEGRDYPRLWWEALDAGF